LSPGAKSIVDDDFINVRKRLKDLIEKINVETQTIENPESNDEAIKNKLSKKPRERYDHVFPFAAMYSFVILVFNGCSWAHENPENEAEFIANLSYFNTWSFLCLTVLIFGRWCTVRFFPKLEKKCAERRYTNLISVGVMALVILGSFYYFPIHYYVLLDFFSPKANTAFTVILTMLIGAYPIAAFVIQLKLLSKKFVSAAYEKEIRAMRDVVNATMIAVPIRYQKVNLPMP
jgi:magnesium-transporting ATPase (P-type)